MTPGSAVRHASVARHVTDCATRPSRAKSVYQKVLLMSDSILDYDFKTNLVQVLIRAIGSFKFEFMLYIPVEKVSVILGCSSVESVPSTVN